MLMIREEYCHKQEDETSVTMMKFVESGRYNVSAHYSSANASSSFSEGLPALFLCIWCIYDQILLIPGIFPNTAAHH
jgi:hypothetical protein